MTRSVFPSQPTNCRTAFSSTLTREQQRALGDLAILAGPAFLIGLWGVTALISGLVSLSSTIM
jgi:hypothetical protein